MSFYLIEMMRLSRVLNKNVGLFIIVVDILSDELKFE